MNMNLRTKRDRYCRMTFYLHIQESEDHVVESPNEAPVHDWSICVDQSEHVQSRAPGPKRVRLVFQRRNHMTF